MNHVLKDVTNPEDMSSYHNPNLPVDSTLISNITNFINKYQTQ